MPEIDDIVMQQVRDGEVGKLAVLFERHHKPLFNFFLRMTGDRALSEDLVQDVFFRILKFRHTYAPGMGFTPWMYQIARNAHHDSWQRRKTEAPEEAAGDPASQDPDPSEFMRRKQEIALVRRALARLPEEKREVLVMSRYQGLKYEQIAGILAIEEGAVKVRVYRAMKALGQIFFQLAGEKAS